MLRLYLFGGIVLIISMLLEYLFYIKPQDRVVEEVEHPSSSLSSGPESNSTSSLTLPPPSTMESPYVYLDISRKKEYIGRIILFLHSSIVPKTCYNFYELCNQKAYRNVPFHRVIRDFMIQSGDIVDKDGSNGMSVYGDYFPDENFEIAHEKGCISMANSGVNTNNSQFFIITTDENVSHLDGKHVVFGKVVHGMDVVMRIEQGECNHSYQPHEPFYITDCGILVS